MDGCEGFRFVEIGDVRPVRHLGEDHVWPPSPHFGGGFGRQKVGICAADQRCWQPIERVYWGVEYLHGTRENISGESGSANRLQTSFIFNLP